ncbi:hypothetical protein GQ42DRAFT_20091 [Ramicandelaber brevisporus]|nr:hypothetical protein GQ42DRAFT_20091 [Ramicandelaber brevisporus]
METGTSVDRAGDGCGSGGILLAACREDNVDLLDDLLEEPSALEINAVDNLGCTCLHCCAQNGSLSCLELFVQHMEDIHASSHEVILRTLDPNAKTRLHAEPIHSVLTGEASDYTGGTGLEALGGNTPLHLAVRYQRDPDVALRSAMALISLGADPTICDGGGLRPIDIVPDGFTEMRNVILGAMSAYESLNSENSNQAVDNDDNDDEEEDEEDLEEVV